MMLLIGFQFIINSNFVKKNIQICKVNTNFSKKKYIHNIKRASRTVERELTFLHSTNETSKK